MVVDRKVDAEMNDLIDRQNAINVLEILADKMSDEGQTVMAQAVAVLKDLRSEEPERKRGKWIYEGKRGRFPACKCSICGHYENADWAMLQGANFCPNCGADMREEYEDIPMEYFENGGI